MKQANNIASTDSHTITLILSRHSFAPESPSRANTSRQPSPYRTNSWGFTSARSKTCIKLIPDSKTLQTNPKLKNSVFKKQRRVKERNLKQQIQNPQRKRKPIPHCISVQMTNWQTLKKFMFLLSECICTLFSTVIKKTQKLQSQHLNFHTHKNTMTKSFFNTKCYFKIDPKTKNLVANQLHIAKPCKYPIDK